MALAENGDEYILYNLILPDDHTARLHAMQIIHELQKGDELAWGSLTMEVTRDGRVLWRIPFEVPDPPS